MVADEEERSRKATQGRLGMGTTAAVSLFSPQSPRVSQLHRKPSGIVLPYSSTISWALTRGFGIDFALTGKEGTTSIRKYTRWVRDLRR
jgi:hypothetical protein